MTNAATSPKTAARTIIPAKEKSKRINFAITP